MGQFFLICWFILETEAQICSAPMTAEKANELFADALKYQTYIYIKQAETDTDIADITSQMNHFQKRNYLHKRNQFRRGSHRHKRNTGVLNTT